MRSPNLGSCIAQQGSAESGATDAGPQARASGSLRLERAQNLQSGAPVEARQVKARRNVEPNDEEPPAQRLHHGPAGLVLQRGEAVAEAPAQEALPPVIMGIGEGEPDQLGFAAPVVIGGHRPAAGKDRISALGGPATIPFSRSGHSSRDSASRHRA